MIRKTVLIALTLALCASSFSNSNACSVCRCGDNAFLFSQRGFGMPDPAETHRFWFSFGNLYSTKSNGLSDGEGIGTERQRETRPSFRLSYSPSDLLSFSLETPFQFRRIVTSAPQQVNRQNSSGIGDAELSTTLTRKFGGSNGRFYSGALAFMMKLPTGNNRFRQSGERLDEHLQPGTGTYDWQIGGALSRLTSASRVFVSAYYRFNGTNDFSYHYGDALLMNLGSQWPLTEKLSVSLEANSRYARRDTDHSDFVDNTGGWVAYIAPGARLNLTTDVGIFAGVQIPVYENLFGTQTEKSVLNTGLSFEF